MFKINGLLFFLLFSVNFCVRGREQVVMEGHKVVIGEGGIPPVRKILNNMKTRICKKTGNS